MTSTLTKTVKESKQEASYPTTMQTHNFTLLLSYKQNRTNYNKMWIYVKYTLCYSECNWYTWNAEEQERLIKIGMYESKRIKTIILI